MFTFSICFNTFLAAGRGDDDTHFHLDIAYDLERAMKKMSMLFLSGHHKVMIQVPVVSVYGHLLWESFN